jgi:hypothetical protein
MLTNVEQEANPVYRIHCSLYLEPLEQHRLNPEGTSAWQEGRSLTAEAAISYVLTADPDPASDRDSSVG